MGKQYSTWKAPVDRPRSGCENGVPFTLDPEPSRFNCLVLSPDMAYYCTFRTGHSWPHSAQRRVWQARPGEERYFAV